MTSLKYTKLFELNAIKCAWCGSEFEPPFLFGYGRYCSRRCQKEATGK